MNVYIFAIGGTGARVLRSLTFCLASGMKCIPDGTSFIPMIIDYDKTNGDKERAKRNLTTYSNIRNAAYKGVTPEQGERNFFMPEIKFLSDVGTIPGKTDIALNPSYEYKFGIGQANQTGTFADYMDCRNMMGATYLTKELLSSLYNDEPTTSSMSELNLDLSVGFKGNPNIGSIIFENIREDAEFKRFLNTFDPQKDRVFIISSIFGGTGSSGFPRIVDAIRYSGIADYDKALVGASIVMPYFKVNTPAGGAINSNIFNSKQKAALSYYQKPDDHGKSLYQKLTTSYFIGDDVATNLPYCEGSNGQANDAHIVELLAALSIIDFVSTDEATLRKQTQKEYGLESTPSATESIQLKHFVKSDRSKYFDYITRMALAFRYYEEYILEGEINSREAFYSNKGLGLEDKIGEDMYKDLESFITDFDQWLDELAVQKDSFKPYLHKPRVEDSNAPVSEDLDDYIEGYEGSTGGTFRDGTSYKDFSGYCSKFYKEYGKDLENEDYAFLSIFYDAAEKCMDYYDQIKN